MATKTSKVKSNKKTAALTKKNVKNLEKVITDKKDLDYIYPKDAADLPSRKKFRSICRRKIKSFIKQIEKSRKAKDADALAKAIDAHNKYVKSIHTNPEIITK